MRIASPVWTFLLVPLTAIAVFALYRGATRGSVADLDGVGVDRPAPTALADRGETLQPAAAAATAQRASPPPSAAPVEREPLSPRSAAQEELAAMSESFRNTTLLIAIRDAGYVCPHMFGADAGAQGVAAWRVRCSDAFAYVVGVNESGELEVDPTAYAEGIRSFRVPEKLREPDSTQLNDLRERQHE